ncbi:beta-lactamase superfamily domain-containing protein [Lasiosphaeria hispida]|uniref:Beta-lactamase superfamily domain-containing protein n=1 Tax=Lasiosphaeria hispida TaxID=260671 RepID=A0AAJ0HGT9_9PEZI|nr:beta-lactamase superfamily domain-containing protein [Lasiosphaeria hispida]
MAVPYYNSTVSKPAIADDAPSGGDLTAHHVKDKHGETIKFQNPHPSFGETLRLTAFAMGRKMIWTRLMGDMKDPDISSVKIPTVKPTFLAPGGGLPTSLRATWLGHACYFVEFPSGLRVLFDPVFEDRCSPLTWFGPKRFTPPPCAPADIPAIDAVVISHSHYDHLSHTSVSEIASRHPGAQFFVPLGLKSWFRESGIERVTEMDWWEDAELLLKRGKAAAEDPNVEKRTSDSVAAKVSCLPCQHSSGRTHNDRDHTLWASWAVSSGGKSVWFGGDTGYRAVPRVEEGADDYGPEYEALPRCPQFAQIGKLRGPFDLGLIPIGAYKPRWIMSGMHADPRDAVEIFKDTRCKKAMGIHWGTWILTSEDVEEPPKKLMEALKKAGIPEKGVFDVCAAGESREF